MIRNILTIAGTDPSGGAGIQADIKTFSALGTYAMSVITAVVAQNTQGVRSFVCMDPQFVAEQIDAIFQDIQVDAVKIGMLANQSIVEAVTRKLREYQVKRIVVDPVMVAKSGDRLIDERAVAVMKSELFPLATVITPNIPEACALLREKGTVTLETIRDTARCLLRFGSEWVLLKGGHLAGNDCLDILCNQQGEEYAYSDQRVDVKNTHGTGCTLSSAITALLPDMPVPKAVAKAKGFLTQALITSNQLNVGRGHGPLNHFYGLWKT